MKVTFISFFMAITLVCISSCNKSDTPVSTSNNVPTSPQSVVATPGNLIATLTWQPPSNIGSSAITGYNIYRGLTSGGQTFIKVVSGSALSYIDSNLTNGTKYYYYVTALNNAGESNRSNEAYAIPRPDPIAPTIPTNVTLIPSNKKVTISWGLPVNNGGDPVIGYKIFRGPNSNNLTLLTTIDTLKPKNYVDSTVINYNIYYYSMTAFNNFGESIRTSPVGVTPTSQDIHGTWKLVKMLGNLQDVCLGEIAVFNNGTATLTCPGGSPITRNYTYLNNILTYINSGVSYNVSFTTINGVEKMIMSATSIQRVLTYDKLSN